MRELIRALYLLFVLAYFVSVLYVLWRGIRGVQQ